MHRSIVLTTAILISAGLAASSVARGEMFVYRDRGQSEEQESRDKWECHQWLQQTGVDPEQLAQQASSMEGGRGYS